MFGRQSCQNPRLRTAVIMTTVNHLGIDRTTACAVVSVNGSVEIRIEEFRKPSALSTPGTRCAPRSRCSLWCLHRPGSPSVPRPFSPPGPGRSAGRNGPTGQSVSEHRPVNSYSNYCESSPDPTAPWGQTPMFGHDNPRETPRVDTLGSLVGTPGERGVSSPRGAAAVAEPGPATAGRRPRLRAGDRHARAVSYRSTGSEPSMCSRDSWT